MVAVVSPSVLSDHGLERFAWTFPVLSVPGDALDLPDRQKRRVLGCVEADVPHVVLGCADDEVAVRVLLYERHQIAVAEDELRVEPTAQVRYADVGTVERLAGRREVRGHRQKCGYAKH